MVTYFLSTDYRLPSTVAGLLVSKPENIYRDIGRWTLDIRLKSVGSGLTKKILPSVQRFALLVHLYS